MDTLSTTDVASSPRSTSWRRSTSRPVSSRLMSSSSVTRRVTRSASWWTASSIIRFCSSRRRSQRCNSRLVYPFTEVSGERSSWLTVEMISMLRSVAAAASARSKQSTAPIGAPSSSRW